MRCWKTMGLAAAAATAVLGLSSAANAAAVRDPVLRWSEMSAPPGTFFLNNQDDREVIHYTTPRDVRLCLPPAEETPGGRPAATVPLRVTWDGINGTLYPGNCLFFDAKRVTVKPAAALPSNVVLRGTVETASALN